MLNRKILKPVLFFLLLVFILCSLYSGYGSISDSNKNLKDNTNHKQVSSSKKLVKAPFFEHVDKLPDLEAPEGFDWQQFKGITLNFISENNIYANVLSKESEQFTKVTGITVNIHPMDFNTIDQKISLDFISKTAKYQIIYADPYQTMVKFPKNLVDLNKFNNDPSLPHIPGGIEDFIDFQVDVDSRFIDRDKLYTIPFDSTTMILFYRKDIFEKYGKRFKEEKGYDWTPGSKSFTWERYCEVADWINKNVPKNEVEYGCGHQAKQDNSIFCDFSNVLTAFGGKYFDNSNIGLLGILNRGKSVVSSKETIKALEMYKKILSVAHPSSTSWDWIKLSEEFKAGKLAMMPNWNEHASSIEDPTKSKVVGKVGYSILPYGSVQSANIFGGTGIGINKDASEVEQKASWLFILWATSPQVENLVLKHPEGGDIPARNSIYELPEVKKALAGDKEVINMYPAMGSLSAVVKAWKDENRYLRPKLSNSTSIEKIIQDSISRMLNDNISAKETARDIAGNIDSYTGK